MKVSDCCGAPATEYCNDDTLICPECREHCDFINEEEDEEENPEVCQ